MLTRNCSLRPEAAKQGSQSVHSSLLGCCADAKLVSACSDLTMMVALNVRGQHTDGVRRAARCRLELIRLINLVHVLVCISADGANKVFARTRWTRCVAWAAGPPCTVPALCSAHSPTLAPHGL
jgi:hypothetical protein